jgi:hypothetical protein
MRGWWSIFDRLNGDHETDLNAKIQERKVLGRRQYFLGSTCSSFALWWHILFFDVFDDVFVCEAVERFWWVLGNVVGGEGEGSVVDFDDGGDDCADGIFGWRPGISDGGVELLRVCAGLEGECGLMPVCAGLVAERVADYGYRTFASGAMAFPMALEMIEFDRGSRRGELGGGDQG